MGWNKILWGPETYVEGHRKTTTRVDIQPVNITLAKRMEYVTTLFHTYSYHIVDITEDSLIISTRTHVEEALHLTKN